MQNLHFIKVDDFAGIGRILGAIDICGCQPSDLSACQTLLNPARARTTHWSSIVLINLFNSFINSHIYCNIIFNLTLHYIEERSG